ncbi:MAG: putative hydrolase [Friedmanniella sp.]|nr:putative hydrolase [Friedmanniella sp.]
MTVAGSSPSGLRAVVFDIDGTLLDSAAGIVAGFRHALTSVGFPAPSDSVLRADLGPPVGEMFTALGLAPDRLEEAVEAYRHWYLGHGVHRAAPYAGVPDLLATLSRRLPMTTATAKRTDVARAILTAQGLVEHFPVVTGTAPGRTTKAATIAYALSTLGDPDPRRVVMVGDRHSDIVGARACGVLSIGVTWGYGSLAELTEAGPDVLVHSPAELLQVLTA